MVGRKEMQTSYNILTYYRKDNDGNDIPRSQQVRKAAEFVKQFIWEK